MSLISTYCYPHPISIKIPLYPFIWLFSTKTTFFFEHFEFKNAILIKSTFHRKMDDFDQKSTFHQKMDDFDQKSTFHRKWKILIEKALFTGNGRFWLIFDSKMTNISANNGLNNLTPSDRAKLAENRQVMKAYLISKLVAPRYEVDESGRINPEHFKKGHLGSTEYHQRQRTVQ